MENQILLYLLFFLGLWLLMFSIEFLYRKFSLSVEISRKIAHVTTVGSTLSFPYLFKDHWYMMFFAIVLFLLLFASTKTKYLNSLHGIKRKSIGSPILPISIYLVFLVSLKLNNKLLFILPVSILAFSDPVACITGTFCKKYNREIVIFSRNLGKTILGSSAFFFSSLIISLTILHSVEHSFNLTTFGLSLLIAFTSTTTEILSPRGSDNLFVPFVVLLILIVFSG